MATFSAFEYHRAGIFLTADEKDTARQELLDIELLEKEVLQLPEQLQNAIVRLNNKKKELPYLNALLNPSPIRRLPPEVLGEIFMYIKPCNNTYYYWSLVELMHPCLVCSTWRKVIINTPALWTSIFIVDSQKHRHPQFASLLNLWITRSRSLPLSLNSHGELSQDLLDILRPILHRVVKLDINFPGGLPLLCGPCSLDNLKEIEFYLFDDLLPPYFSITAPKLESVTILSNRSCMRDRMGLPWAQVTRMHLKGGWNDEDLLWMLEQCSNLQELRTKICFWFKSPVRPSPVVLPLLHTWEHDDESTGLRLGTFLELPNLHSVDF